MDQPKYVDVSGIRTRYFDAGEGDCVLLIHGGSPGTYFNAEDWEPVLDGLATRFRVLAPDKVGSGFTDNPKTDAEYVIGSTVRHAYDFIQTMGLGRTHLIGHSRGGYTVTRLALEHPEVVNTLTIVDSSSLMTPPNPALDLWKQEAQALKDPREQVRFLMLQDSYRDAHITEQYLDSAVAAGGLNKTREAQQKWASGLGDQFKTDLVARQLETHEWIKAGQLTCPTLVMWAYNDPSATMDRCGVPCMNLIMSSVPRSEMHILNQAGHLSFREQPAAFIGTVVEFIRRNRRGSVEGTREAHFTGMPAHAVPA